MTTLSAAPVGARRKPTEAPGILASMPDVASFYRDGYVVVRGLFSAHEADYYRNEVCQKFATGDRDWETRRCECADGVSTSREFWPVIFNDQLVQTVRAIIGPDARYTRHSDLHAHRGGLGWHRDNSCRTFGVGPDWNESVEPYRVLRVAIYLQSYQESRSMLGVVPGSHRAEQKLVRGERPFWKSVGQLRRLVNCSEPEHSRYGTPLRLKPGVPFVSPPAEPLWIATEPGDCVIFDQRLYHSSSPLFGPKYAIFLSYGGDDQHSRNHLDYFLNRRRDLNYGALDTELEVRLRNADLWIDAVSEKPGS